MVHILHLGVLCLILVLSPSVQVLAETTKPVNMHSLTWTAFAQDVYQAHLRGINSTDYLTEERLGGYAGMPEFYRDVKYIAKASGRLLSHIQWERARPENIYSIEVYRYDQAGRVVRDYEVFYLPDYRKAPSLALVTVHQYPGELHAFRSFDASGYHVLDRCDGDYQGEKIQILLDEDELADEHYNKAGIMYSAVYRRCFDGLPKQVGGLKKPE